MPDKEVRKLAAVMFTDIEGYSALVQEDERGALKKVSAHRRFLEEFTSQHNGKVVAFYGDGSLSIYESAVDAVYCAIEMQKAYRDEDPVPVRIGIHLGDIVLKDNTVFGDGVNIASRIQATGIPGSILISHRVQTEISNHPGIHTKSLGQAKLKNITSPIEIFAVTNDGLTIPSRKNKIRNANQLLRYAALILLACVVAWFIQHQVTQKVNADSFKQEAISIPVFTNHTGDPSLDQIGEMAAHWITKELSSTSDAHVVSYESASEMIRLAGVNLSSKNGRDKYASLSGAVNVVEAFYIQTGSKDSIIMSGYFKNLETGEIKDPSLPDVKCSSANPMDCIKEMSGNIKGYWISRGDKMLTAPNYEAYKAFMAARGAWRSPDNKFVFEQLNKAITLDPTFLDSYFLMLDYFYNKGNNAAAHDTIESIRRKFPDLNPRQLNMLEYHAADVNGKNDEAYRDFMKEYEIDPLDLFTNNSAMVLALQYRNDPVKALDFFNAIPFDSLHLDGCSYCGERLELALWASIESGNMKLANQLALKLQGALYTRQSYGMLIMYNVWKKDTSQINLLLKAAEKHPQLDRGWEYLNYLAGRLFLLRGDKALSLYYAQKAIAVYQKPAIKNDRMLGRSYYLDDQLDESLKYYESAKPADSIEAKRIVGEIGMIYARKGDTIQAHLMIQKLDGMREEFEYGSTEYFQGRIYALLGDRERALTLLESSLQKGQKFEIWATFSHDPDLLTLKDDPGYKKLLVR